MFRHLSRITRWYLGFWLISFRVCKKTDVLNVMSLGFERVLVLAPHADDEWIGCFGFLISEKVSADVLYYQLYGKDSSCKNKQIRDAEIESCSKKKGFHLYMKNELVNQSLEGLLLANKYDAIICPSPYDWHQQHRLVFELMYYALEKLEKQQKALPRVLYYSISVPQRVTNKTYAFFMSKKQQNEKWAFFKENYVSQKMPVLRYKLQERLNTKGYSYSGDLYTEKSIDEVRSDYNRISNISFASNLDALEGMINDIKKIRGVTFEEEDEI